MINMSIDYRETSDKLLFGSMAIEYPALDLVFKLCQELAQEDIKYCHWKSNNALDRSASGDNDLDLLVSREDIPRFSEILYRLGFKRASAAQEKQMYGVVDYFGHDKSADRLIHVHAHYQLILGDDMSKNYRLPIERQYLGSAVQGELFKVPTPEYEFIVLIVRLILKHSTWDAILGRQGTLKPAERKEMAYLQNLIDEDLVLDILKQQLPYIGIVLFKACIQALQPACPVWTRIKTGHKLQNGLQANGRRPVFDDVTLKLWRRVKFMIRRRFFKSSPKYRLENGGAMIAIVGGDGAGKSTAVNALYEWLSRDLETDKAHIGKPAWSWTTTLVRAILKLGNILGLYPVDSSFQKTLKQNSIVSSGYPWLLREACRARDRYWTYIKARRSAANGKLVLVDRFPLAQIKLMDGPQAKRFLDQLGNGVHAEGLLRPKQNSRLVKSIIRQEEIYYHQIVLPELLMVLRVNPEIAVQRKIDEDPNSVRMRSTEIWEVNWDNTTAYVIDGSKSREEVLDELKALIWSKL